MKTKPEQNHKYTYDKNKSAKTTIIFLFLVAVAHFCQKLFFKTSFQVSHNPLYLQNWV